MHGNGLETNETYLPMLCYLLWEQNTQNNAELVLVQAVCENALKKLYEKQSVCEKCLSELW